jgi:hypothetical protein
VEETAGGGGQRIENPCEEGSYIWTRSRRKGTISTKLEWRGTII